MNILGINGSIGWDGNIGFLIGQDYWVHGSGATLFIDGELKGSLSEERLTRVKYDGNYPENVITNILKENNLNNDDIVNILDIIITVNIILGTSPFNEAGDINMDGYIDILDIVLIVNIILNDN